jgi:hypothetical protein
MVAAMRWLGNEQTLRERLLSATDWEVAREVQLAIEEEVEVLWKTTGGGITGDGHDRLNSHQGRETALDCHRKVE